MEQKKREQKATRRDGNISEVFTFLRRLMKRRLVSLPFYGILVPNTHYNLSEFRFQVLALGLQTLPVLCGTHVQAEEKLLLPLQPNLTHFDSLQV